MFISRVVTLKIKLSTVQFFIVLFIIVVVQIIFLIRIIFFNFLIVGLIFVILIVSFNHLYLPRVTLIVALNQIKISNRRIIFERLILFIVIVKKAK